MTPHGHLLTHRTELRLIAGTSRSWYNEGINQVQCPSTDSMQEQKIRLSVVGVREAHPAGRLLAGLKADAARTGVGAEARAASDSCLSRALRGTPPKGPVVHWFFFKEPCKNQAVLRTVKHSNICDTEKKINSFYVSMTYRPSNHWYKNIETRASMLHLKHCIITYVLY